MWPGRPGHVARTATWPGQPAHVARTSGPDRSNMWPGRPGHVARTATWPGQPAHVAPSGPDSPDMWPGRPGHVAGHVTCDKRCWKRTAWTDGPVPLTELWPDFGAARTSSRTWPEQPCCLCILARNLAGQSGQWPRRPKWAGLLGCRWTELWPHCGADGPDWPNWLPHFGADGPNIDPARRVARTCVRTGQPGRPCTLARTARNLATAQGMWRGCRWLMDLFDLRGWGV